MLTRDDAPTSLTQRNSRHHYFQLAIRTQSAARLAQSIDSPAEAVRFPILSLRRHPAISHPPPISRTNELPDATTPRWLQFAEAHTYSFMKSGAGADVRDKKTAPARTTPSLRLDANILQLQVTLANTPETATLAESCAPGDGRWLQPVQYRRPILLF